MIDNSKPTDVDVVNDTGKEKTPPKPPKPHKLKGTIEIFNPVDEAVSMDLRLFDDGAVIFTYGRMSPQEYQVASGLGAYILSNIGPVSVAVRECTNEGPFDVDRIVIAHAKRLCETVAKQAELGYRYTVA
jgi:hypothetical protein